MPIRIVVTFCAALVCCAAQARPLEQWTFQRLNSRADVVIIASVVSTESIDELLESDPRHPKKQERDARSSIFAKLAFPENIKMDARLTTFKVATVMKGEINDEEMQLVHYEVAERFLIANSPSVAVFRDGRHPRNKPADDHAPEIRIATDELQYYMLFLKARKDGKYEPVSGQIDSAFSVVELKPQLGE